MKAKFYLPQNIFSRILLSEIEDNSGFEFEFLPSSLIVKNVLKNVILIQVENFMIPVILSDFIT